MVFNIVTYDERQKVGEGQHERAIVNLERFNLAICQHMCYNTYLLEQNNFSVVLTTFFIWGCRVSTGEQIEELQVEVSVRTLVKQPTKN